MPWSRTLWHTVHGCKEQCCYSMIPTIEYNHSLTTNYSGHLLPQQKQFRIECCMFIESEQLRRCFAWVAAVVYVQLLTNPGKYGHVVSVRMRIRLFDVSRSAVALWRDNLTSLKYDFCPDNNTSHLQSTVHVYMQIFSVIFKILIV